MSKKISPYYTLPAIIISTFLVLSLVFAWTEPSTAPPGGNVSAPINVGGDLQSKSGSLLIKGPTFEAHYDTYLATVSGKVGIGTPGPNDKLEVAATSGNLGIRIANTGNTAADFSALRLYQGGVQKGVIYTNQEDLYVRTPGGAGQDLLLQTSGGNVGIGTTGPRNNLEVGNTTANQTIRVGGIYRGPGSGYTGTGQETTRHQLVFSSWRDVQTDTIGAKIVGINLTNYISPKWDLVQKTDLAFFTLNTTPGSIDATTEKMRLTAGGNVGIGDASPASLFTVGSGDLFQVSSSGDLVKIRNVTYSWPSAQGAANTFLQNNGTGTLSWVAAGGGGTVTSVGTGTGLTGGPITTSGTISIAPGGVGTTELANNAVTTAKITDLTVTTAKIANLGVTTAKIAASAVTNAKISEMDWVKLQNYPVPCLLGEFVTQIGDTITCAEPPTAINYWTLSGSSLYPNLTTYNLGVGTTSLDSNYRITTSGGGIKAVSSSQPAGYFSSATGYGLIVDSGSVGIGTVSPGYKFEVETTGSTASTEYLLGAFDEAASGGGVYLGYYVGPTAGTVQEARVRAGANKPLALGTTNYKQAIYILDTNGNVGIGTPGPNDKLEVAATSGNLGIRIANTGNTAADFSALRLYQGGVQKGVIYTNQEDLYVRTPGGAGQDLLLQTSGGNVGIGTTPDPLYRLHSVNSGAGGVGVTGEATGPCSASDDCPIGVYGVSNVANGRGVVASAVGDNAIGLQAVGQGTNSYAGFFNGSVRATNSETSQSTAIFGQSTFTPTASYDYSIGVGGTNYDKSAQGALGEAWYSGSKLWNFGVGGWSSVSGERDYAGLFAGNVIIYPYGATTVPAQGSNLLLVNGDAAKPGGGSWTGTSDIRLKKDVTTIDNPLERMLQLHGVEFEWDEPATAEILPGVQLGMVAQEVEKVFPQWVSTGKDGYKDLTFRGFEALTVEAIRALKAENDALQTKSQELEERIKVLEEALNITR